MSSSQAASTRLLALLQEASDVARTVTLPDGREVGPILAAIVQDLRNPVIRPSRNPACTRHSSGLCSVTRTRTKHGMAQKGVRARAA